MTPLSDTATQPLGPSVNDWQPPRPPSGKRLSGHDCRIAPLNVAAHGNALFNAWQNEDASRWVYLGGRPFSDRDSCQRWLSTCMADDDPYFMAIIEQHRAQAQGIAAWLNIIPAHGTLELGYLHFSMEMARTRMATEALYLLIDHAFSLGYRRVEWKCDALNAPSRRAAERLGFRFEGTFYKHRVVQGRNRDTAWFALLDHQWPTLAACHRQWLAPDNFDTRGRQRQALSQMIAAVRRDA